jgi:Lrp/AsnC family leucine-responsive transcriptional regulator
LDRLDRKTLDFLMRDGRATWAELGEELGLSPPAAAERARKLLAERVVTGYTAMVSPEKLGFPLTAYVAVTLGDRSSRSQFLRIIERHEQVSECHHVAGEDDYLAKVRCRSTGDLDRFLSKTLKDELGVARTRTTIVLSTAKETVRIPVDER